MDTTKAFTRIYEENFEFVYRLLWRFGVPERDREDVAHDLFIVVHRKLDDYDDSRPIRPWLAGYAFRVARAYSRRRMQGEVPSVLPEIADAADNAETHSMQAERRRKAMDILGTLPMEQRAVLVLHELEGLTAPEISSALTVPVNTVYSRLRIARRVLTERSQQKGGER